MWPQPTCSRSQTSAEVTKVLDHDEDTIHGCRCSGHRARPEVIRTRPASRQCIRPRREGVILILAGLSTFGVWTRRTRTRMIRKREGHRNCCTVACRREPTAVCKNGARHGQVFTSCKRLAMPLRVVICAPISAVVGAILDVCKPSQCRMYSISDDHNVASEREAPGLVPIPSRSYGREFVVYAQEWSRLQR